MAIKKEKSDRIESKKNKDIHDPDEELIYQFAGNKGDANDR